MTTKKINLRGFIFEIPVDILTMIPNIIKLYNGKLTSYIPYINRSPYAFDSVINYLSDKDCTISPEHTLELKYFGIEIKANRIDDQIYETVATISDEIRVINNNVVLNYSLTNALLSENRSAELYIKNAVKSIFRQNVLTNKTKFVNCYDCSNFTSSAYCSKCTNKPSRKCSVTNCLSRSITTKYCIEHEGKYSKCSNLKCLNNTITGTLHCFYHQ